MSPLPPEQVALLPVAQPEQVAPLASPHLHPALAFESVGPVVYYVAGHYDAKHDIWTDYGYKSKTSTADVGNAIIPVEEVYTYCLKNPKDTVVNAINKQKH